MKKSVPILAFLLFTFFITGCENNTSELNTSIPIAEGAVSKSEDKKETDEKTTFIKLVDNASTSDDAFVSIENNIITITKAGDYEFSGKLSDGQIIINTPDEDVKIILNNVTIINASGPAIYVQKAKNANIVLAKNSTNVLSDGTDYLKTNTTEDTPSAVIYSTADLKIKGKSKSELNITGLYNDGIVSKDDLEIKDAVINITAVDDGIRGKDSVTIEGATLEIIAKGDAIKSDNNEDEGRGIITIEKSNIKITAGDDAIHGVQVVEILSGNIDILKSYEGIEGKKITINDGIINLVSSDDGLNVAEKKETTETEDGGMFDRGGKGGGGGMNSVLEGGMLTINGGTITMDTGGDGFDSNGNAAMTGGTLIVNGPTNDGNGPLDVNGSFEVSGGTIIAVGSSGMAETPDETSSQYSIQVNFEEKKEAGTVVSLLDEKGKEIFTFIPEKMFQSVTFSSSKLKKGATYTFLINGENFTTLTLESSVTKYGTGNRMGGGHGARGDRESMGTPPNMDLPDDWDDMTEEEQKVYMEANRPEMGGDRMNDNFMENMNLPENWETMTEDEKHEYMEANRPEGMEPPQ